MTDPALRLPEEILLLALDDAKGTIEFGSLWQQAAGGAIVAELLLGGRLRASDHKRARLEVVDATPLGDPVLDDALREIGAAHKPKAGADWVSKLGGRRDLKERLTAGLVARGVLAEREGKVLGIFPQTQYPARDGRPEKEVVARLERAIFTDTRDLAPRTVVLVALANAAGLLPNVFAKRRLKDRKERLQRITTSDAAGAMTREAIEAMQAAIAVAAIMPAFFVSTT